MTKPLILLSISASLLLLANAEAQVSPIDNLQPGHWIELPETKIRSVAPNQFIDGVNIGNVKNVINAWSGGAFDTVNNRFFIKGGGHGSYGGNEVYSYDVDDGVLTRIWGPSPFAGWTDGDILMPDGAPVAAHSTDHIVYIPTTDKFCTFTNMPTWAWAQRWDKTSYCLDFETGIWSPIANMPKAGNYMFSAFDPVTQHVFVHGGGNYQWLKEYDPVNDQWISRGNMWTDSGFYFGAYYTAAIDSDRRLFVAVGKGQTVVWNISDPSGTVAGQRVNTVGDTEIESSLGPGFAYDPTNKVFVAWDGGADVFVLDPEEWRWTRVPAALSNNVVPTSTADTFGTYGRFRYIPSKNAFITVASVDDNMYAYKLDMSPPDPDTTPPSAPTGLTAALIQQTGVELSWIASADPESGIQRYDVFRDGVLVGSAGGTSFSDTNDVSPGTTYAYYVVAINNAGLISAPSETSTVTTEADVQPPVIVSVVAQDATTLRITFDEMIDPTTATRPENYALAPGLAIVSISLESDGKTVTIETTPHGQYSIVVDGVKDLYENPAISESSSYSYP